MVERESKVSRSSGLSEETDLPHQEPREYLEWKMEYPDWVPALPPALVCSWKSGRKGRERAGEGLRGRHS